MQETRGQDGKISWRRNNIQIFLPEKILWAEEPNKATVHRVTKSKTLLEVLLAVCSYFAKDLLEIKAGLWKLWGNIIS